MLLSANPRSDGLMQIERVLIDLGFQDTEARFYLAALELGQAPVSDIAKKAEISRTNAYDVFARLLEQGLVTQVGNASGKTMLVAAEAPENLLAIFEERRRKLQSVMPDLRSLHNRSMTKPRVRFYQGIEGIKTVLNDTIACRSKALRGILSMRDLYQVPGRAWMDDLVRRRIEAGVFLRVIRSPINDLDDIWPDSRDDLRELRFAPSEFVFTMTTYIFDEKVAVISSQRENFAMTIESEEFTSLQGNLFEALWAASASAASAKRRTAKLRPVRTNE